MKGAADITEDLLVITKLKALQYFVETVTLDRSKLPKTVNHYEDDVFAILQKFKLYLTEINSQYQDSIPQSIPQFSILANLFFSGIKNLCDGIDSFNEDIIYNGENPVNLEILRSRDNAYFEMVQEFDKLFILEKKLKRAILSYIHKENSTEEIPSEQVYPSINDQQKVILDSCIEIWCDSILSSFLGLTGLKAIFDESLLKMRKDELEATQIYPTILEIKSIFTDHFLEQSDQVMPKWFWPRKDAAWIHKEYLSSLTNYNDDTALPITTQDVVKYVSNNLKLKIIQLEAINFEDLGKTLNDSIKNGDFESFKKNIITLEKNAIFLDIYFYPGVVSWVTPLSCAVNYARIEMVYFLLKNGADPNFNTGIKSIRFSPLVLITKMTPSFAAEHQITVKQRCEIIKMLVTAGASLQNLQIPFLQAQPLEILQLLLKLGLTRENLLLNTINIATEFKDITPDVITEEKLLFLQKQGVNFYQVNDKGYNCVDYLLINYGVQVAKENTLAQQKILSILKFLFDNSRPDFCHLKYIDCSGEVIIPILKDTWFDTTKDLVAYIKSYHGQQTAIREMAGRTFSEFPIELMYEILVYLDPQTLPIFSSVSKTWQMIIYERRVINSTLEKLPNPSLLAVLLSNTSPAALRIAAKNVFQKREIVSVNRILKKISTKKLIQLFKSYFPRKNFNGDRVMDRLLASPSKTLELSLMEINPQNIDLNDIDPLFVLLLDERIINAPLFEDGNTLLHCACSYDNDAKLIIGLLLKLGADRLIRNLDGDIPLHRAYLFKQKCIGYFFNISGPCRETALESQEVIKNNRGKTPKENIDLWYLENLKKKLRPFWDASNLPVLKKELKRATQVGVKSKALQLDCGRDIINFTNTIDDRSINTESIYLPDIQHKLRALYAVKEAILAEADRNQEEHIINGKEKALAIKSILSEIWPLIYPKAFDLSYRSADLKELLLNTENGKGQSVKKALEIDCHPKIIALMGRWLFNKSSTTSYDKVKELEDPKAPEDSDDKSFGH